MFDPIALTALTLTFLLAGMVKGVIGLGLPSVSLALLAVIFDLPTAMALLLVPSFCTNLWQASVGGNAALIIRRLWPFLVAATFTVWLGAIFLVRVDTLLLSGLLGLLLMAYAALNLAGVKITIPPRSEPWSAPLFGIVNGVLTGMTGSFVVPGVLYLQALGLDRNVLIQAMGMLFTLSTLALGIALQDNQLLTTDLGKMSSLSLIPAIIGMVLGQKIRSRLSEVQFRKVFFISLLAMGAYISLNAARVFFAV